MRRSKEKLTLLCFALAALTTTASAPTAAAEGTPAPAWAPLAAAGPTNLPPEGKGTIAAYVQNVGGKTSEGTIRLTDQLPAGIVTTGTPFPPGGASLWSCSAGAGQGAIECTTTEKVAPGLTAVAINIPVEVEAGAVTGQNILTVKGGEAAEPPATFKAPITISATPAKAGIAALSVGTYDADGTPTTLAASHPYASDVGVLVNTVRTPDGKAVVPAGDPRTISVDLPPGFLGNPTATQRCAEGLLDSKCPLESQVGLAGPVATNFGSSPRISGVHSAEAPIGYPAKFTFGVVGDLYQANLLASLRSDEDYGVTITAPNIAQINPVYGSFASVWGAPGSPDHDKQRCAHFDPSGVGVECGPIAKGTQETAFVTMASDCAMEAVQPPSAKVSFDSWQDPGNFNNEVFALPAVTDCSALSMAGATFSLSPEREEAASPSAYEAEMTLPQDGLLEPEARATPPLKHTVIAFPSGVTLNPSAADNLATCSLAQIGWKGNDFKAPNRIRFDKEPVKCPDASKVGSLEVSTALLENPLHGSLYVAAQDENPFGGLLAVYLVIEDPTVGIVIKLPGEMRIDPVTGQLTSVFDDLPPAAVGRVTLKVMGGDRAPLATPDTCGTFTTVGELTPWSAPESGPPTPTSNSFEVKSGPAGAKCVSSKAERPFAPSLSAGTTATSAGAYSPFELTITRRDGEQELKGLQMTLPPGLTGKLAGIETCSDGQIATAEARSGRAEQVDPSCPSSSQLGTVSSAAGIGNTPIHVGGKVYLAPPYKGAPLSVVAIIPAVAGPFDLGTVVSRTAAYLNPETAQLTAVSDPIPDVLKGVPVQLRSIRVDLNRSGFMLTPTNCDKKAISVKLTGAGGDTATAADDLNVTASVPFRIGGCKNLAFKPKFSATLLGGTRRNDHPSLRTALKFPSGPGYANTASAQVALPHSEFLDQGHIRTVCTRVQFAADACPKGSIYGHAVAITPLLDESLSGPVYLRSSNHKLPDVVIALKGPPSRPVEVDVAGRVDSINGGIRNSFEMTPDAPVSKFVVTLRGGNRGLLVNSSDLCRAKRKPRMTVRLLAQNGKRGDQFPVLGNDCGKKNHGRRTYRKTN